ncbi:acetyl-CoA carboxylase biotin carboxyl carrier protein [Paenibacillus shirakamiensis]|uniref:Biotin carboxyl carrier protein of acetyl-CoA carboxylase n=1 Tax=Paenibacillus shirakamiensis TaxID=1265935 RepID=A0ABS4JCH8_9BACL|nr:acetyl-CoA carboxylase biotin carboxyl carrier protein [Paenibacillus shirakamiensis]MBP1999437.1 acetyl-CoA carboxylase biotin carboxyl carrier protein [Paenibacillus shirakamiensis]
MFKLNEIKELIKLVDSTSIHELEIENEGTRLAIRKPGKTEIVQVQSASPSVSYIPSPTPQAVVEHESPTGSAQTAPSSQEAATIPNNLHTIVSPMVGTFYSSSSPEKPPYISSGDKVHEKTTVCIIEAMKLMNELEAEIKGEIVEILVENGQLVEYGQPLFLVKPE